MQYMLLIYGDPTVTAQSADVGPDQIMDWVECTKALHAEGALRGGDGLQPVDTATTVRVRGGEHLVTDGPFAETKEHLLGYYVIDVPDLDRALYWARRMPTAHWGSVEVRAIAGSTASGDALLAGERASERP